MSIATSYADMKVLKACVDTDTPVTFSVINAVWRWFLDVEFALPIAILEMPDETHTALTKDVVAEMCDIFAAFEAAETANPDFEPGADPRVHTLNALWRELAGLYAPLLNDSVETIPDEVLQVVYPRAIAQMAHMNDLDIDDAIDKVKNDPMIRMMMRRSGLDPDMALAAFDGDSGGFYDD